MTALALTGARVFDGAQLRDGVAVIVEDGVRRMMTENHTGFYYITMYNENHQQPAMPVGAEDGIRRGLYLLRGSTLEAARTYGFPLERLIFEAVEGEHVESNKHLMTILREYREFGFKTAIDDFGAGYSGLNLLADFQPDLIKLDMALIRNIHRDRVRQTIVRNVEEMLGLEPANLDSEDFFSHERRFRGPF